MYNITAIFTLFIQAHTQKNTQTTPKNCTEKNELYIISTIKQWPPKSD